MKREAINFSILLVLALTFTATARLYFKEEIMVFFGILATTTLLMAFIPKKVGETLKRDREDSCKTDSKFMKLSARDRKKRMRYTYSLIRALAVFLFIVIALGGLTMAFLYSGAVENTQEIGYGNYQLTMEITRILISLWIIAFTLFLSQAIPILLVKLLHNFSIQLKTLGPKKKAGPTEESSEPERLPKELEPQKERRRKADSGTQEDDETGAETGKEAVKAEAGSGEGDKELLADGNETKDLLREEGSGEEKEEDKKNDEVKAEESPDEEETVASGQAGSEEETTRFTPEEIESLFISFFRYTIMIVGFVYAIATLGFSLDTTLGYGDFSITIQDLVNMVISGIIIAVFMVCLYPTLLKTLFQSLFQIYNKRYRNDEDRLDLVVEELTRVKPGVENTLFYFIVFAGIFIVLSPLPHEALGPSLGILDKVLLTLILLLGAFVYLTVTPLLVYSISQGEVREIKETPLFQAARYLTYLVLLLVLFAVLNLWGMDLGTPISLGDTSVTIWGIITAVVIMVVSQLMSRLLIAMLKETVMSPEQMDEHATIVLEKIIHTTIVGVGFVVAIGSMGLNLVALITGLGIIGFALAFGMQETISNFVAGIIIAVEKPFRIGDRVRVGDESGDVIDIGIRSTQIRTTKNEIVIIPNSLIANGEVWNLTKDTPTIANVVDVGIDYDADWHQAEQIAIDIANAHPEMIHKEKTHVRMVEHGSSSVNMELWMWIADAKRCPIVKSDILKELKNRFDEAGISIPFPHRTLTFKYDSDKERFMKEGRSEPKSSQEQGEEPVEEA